MHWDGKLLKAQYLPDKENRLAVIVTGYEVEKLLGVPVTENGTGEAEAEAVHERLEFWNLSDKVQAMSFDTTKSNTGEKIGACTLLESKMKKKLYYLACRHHVMELLPSGVFKCLYPISESPNILMFEDFRKSWSSMNPFQWRSGMEDEKFSNFLQPIKSKIVSFAREQLKNHQPRNDYRKLLQLTLNLFEENTKKVNFLF